MSPSLHAMLCRLQDPNHLWRSRSFSEALARLHFAVEHCHELAVVVGSDGLGTTTLLRRFKRELSTSPAQAVWLQVEGTKVDDLRMELALQLGLANSSWTLLRRRIAELGADEISLVVLVDDAHSASAESFAWLSQLWDVDWSGRSRILLVLATHELDLAQWSREWLDRIDLRVDLDAWSLEDTHSFLSSVVGTEQQRGRDFVPEAVAHIHHVAGGRPRQIHRLAQLSLMAADLQRRGAVDVATVIGVSHELCRPTETYQQEPTAIEFVDELSSYELP